MVVQLMFKYRLYPSGKQKVRLINSFKVCKAIYNELLALNIDAYKFGNVSLNKFDYDAFITGHSFGVYSQVIHNVSDRVHKAFQNFFRRVKDNSCKEKGFPRFKSRVNSITFPQSGFKLISDKQLRLSKIGNIPIILHRLPKGRIKTLTIKQNKARQWFAYFSCELPDVKVKHPSTKKIGIDVGLESFATLSNGEQVANPHFLINSERKLAVLQRRKDRKVKGSANRRKAIFRLNKQHIKVANQRSDFLHKLSRKLTFAYFCIAVEKLDIKGMMNDCFWARQIGDAGWGTFISFLKYKAVTSGGSVVENPKTRGSSHKCSRCGFYVEDMPLSRKTFNCPSCGLVCHRDFNASCNHENDTAGLAGILTPVDIKPLQQTSSAASLVVEAGTISNN